MTPSIEYDAPTLFLNVPSGNVPARPTAESMEDVGIVPQDIVCLNSAATERVEGGTKLLNSMAFNAAMLQLGFGLSEDGQKICVYTLYALRREYFDVAHVKYFRLLEKNSGSNPYEFTLENAPTVSEVSAGADHDAYKQKITFSDMGASGSTVDFRLCAVAYDANNVELFRFYSEQYRYTNDNGTVTRTRFQTTLQDSRYVTAFGLYPIGTNDSLEKNFATVKGNVNVLPVVYGDQPVAYELVIPDSVFDSNPNGLMLATKTGNGRVHCSACIYKASASSDAFYVGATFDDVTGREYLDKTWSEIYSAMRSGKTAFVRTVIEQADPQQLRVSCSLINEVNHEDGIGYEVMTTIGGNAFTYSTDSADGYPYFEEA